MEVVYRRCAGLDVHKQSISACVLISGPGEEPASVEKRTFGTFTSDLVELRDWLKGCGVTHVVMLFSRRAGSKDGSKRLRMAGAVVAVWTFARKLCTSAGDS